MTFMQDREKTLTRIRGFHISAGNAEAMLKAAEGARMDLERVNEILDDAAAVAENRDQLRERFGREIREAEARRPNGSDSLEWNGGIEPDIDSRGAEVFDRVMARCKRELGPHHAGTTATLRMAACGPDRVEFRASTAKYARVLDSLRGPLVRQIMREEFPELGFVAITGPNGEAV